ncbi:MAG: HEPN domain-containing protein [Candidatus Micrarchaeota archaeon]|nr:HEPN domain-containing protein [Candidatus Micrarchaeota archaeon]
MEDIDGAIKSAHEWMGIAEDAMKRQAHAKAVYCMEMAVEAAMKAVLIGVNIEVPKAHDVAGVAEISLIGNRKLQSSFSEGLNGFLETFRTLLKERTAAGYSFNYDEIAVKMKRLATDLFPKCKRIVDECDNEVKHIKKA